MKTEPKRNCQSALDALRVMRQAENQGRDVEITRAGDLKLGNRVPQTGKSGLKWLFDRLFRGSDKNKAEQQRESAIATITNKMKIEVASCSEHVTQTWKTRLSDLRDFEKDGKVRNLDTEWLALKNAFEKEAETQSWASSLNAAAKAAKVPKLPEAVDIANESLNHRANERPPRPGTEKATAAPMAAEALDISKSDTDLQETIAEANRGLPSGFPKITRAGEIYRCTLSVPETVQRGLFNDWRDWRTHARDPQHDGPDPFIGLSEAFKNDAARATYVFERDGFPMECEKDCEAVVTGFKEAAGKNPMRQLILSHLLGQEALKRMKEKILELHPRQDGLTSVIGGESSTEFTQHRLHMKVHENGDVDIDYKSIFKKIDLLGDVDSIDINRSAKFDGPPSKENAGAYMTMKIQLKNSDLNQGQLKFSIIEPLQMALQIEIPDTSKQS